MKKFVLCVMCVALLTYTVQAQSCGGVVNAVTRATQVRDVLASRPMPVLSLLQKISSKRSVRCSGAAVQAGCGGCGGR